jgi:hypothetical protein
MYSDTATAVARPNGALVLDGNSALNALFT